jgi:hypothetical protein
MSYIRQFFLSFIYLINISLSIVFIPNLANSDDDEWQSFIKVESPFLVDITHQDYIDKHVNAKSRKIIQEYREQCILLQQKGNIDNFLNEMSRLHHRTCKKLNKNKLTDRICLAIAEKFYLDPITIILEEIAHAPLEKACEEIQRLRFQLLKQAQEKNILIMDKIKEWLIERYGFNVINVARDCYMARNDHIDIAKNYPTISNNLKHILSIIEHKILPIAHAELIHLKKQILEGLKSLNITDPSAQKNFIIKNFDCDIIELAHNAYRGRSDHKTLVSYFIYINAQKTSIAILNNEHNYESIANKFRELIERIFFNAELCNLTIDSKLKACVVNSISIIKAPHNTNEFVFNVTMINRVLNHIQNEIDGIIDGEPILSEQSSELFTQAVENFIKRTNQNKNTQFVETKN